VERLKKLGHVCLIESDAGLSAGYSNDEYYNAGAEIIPTQDEVYARADIIYKVKEPQRQEWALFKKGQILFAYIHSANREEMLANMLEKEVVGIAYEDVLTQDGHLPMLEPMSIIAGHISQQKAYRYLLADEGNVGIISGNLAGVIPAKVLILGIGFAGEAAIREAHGSGSQVVALYNNNFSKAERIMHMYRGVVCLRSTPDNVRIGIEGAHVVNNCMTWPISLRNEVLVSTSMINLMDDHGIVIDVSSELAGGLETTRGLHTSHADPIVHRAGKAHYVVPNIPAIASRSASNALVNVTLPWAEVIADGWDWRNAQKESPLYRGLTCAGGKIINPVIKEWYDSLH